MTEPSDDDFNWRTDDAVAVREQPAIAIYPNGYGQVVIRREQAWDEDEDCFIPIARENVLTIVGSILQAAEMPEYEIIRAVNGGYQDVDLSDAHASNAKDRTGAERQRRYRRRKRRDAERDETVTRDGDVTPFPLLQAAE